MAFLSGIFIPKIKIGKTSSRARRWPGCFALICILLAGINPARGDTAQDSDLKAVFLFNFAQFVTWPDSAFPNDRAPLVIGILGSDPFGRRLDEVVGKEKVRGRKFAVKRYQRIDEIGLCHILFISQPDSQLLNDLFASLKGKPVLTVGDTEKFATSGGMIRFLTDQSKLRLRINKDAVHAAHLEMSSKLLKAASEIVETLPSP